MAGPFAVGHRSVNEVDTSEIGVYERRQSLAPPPTVENVSFSKYLRYVRNAPCLCMTVEGDSLPLILLNWPRGRFIMRVFN